MYFPALKRAIQSLEEKVFYGIALLYLEQAGYSDLSIVDGTGDGGRDVTCSRSDLRIQLSVRRDWENKVNDEASATIIQNKRHLIYITNRVISPEAEELFRGQKYKQKGEVELTLIDLNRISTSLSRPGVIRGAYEMLGMAIPAELIADPKDIAVSTVLLFSREARELREGVIEATLRAQLLTSPGLAESVLLQRVVEALPGVNVLRFAEAGLARLRGSGRVRGGASGVYLSDSERALMEAAQFEFLAAKRTDIQNIAKITQLNEEDSENLLNLALELLIRKREMNGMGPAEESLRNFIANKNLIRKKDVIFDALASSASARMRQYGQTVDQIFSANSFDVYRALGTRTEIVMVLDASVAMPVLFGLTFGAARSRYGVGALALRAACAAHNIRMVVPYAYLNEVAAHGQGALEKLEIYNALPKEARDSLKASGNAYLSHYTHISYTVQSGGQQLSLKEFLHHFGIYPGSTINKIENRVESIFDAHGIKILRGGRYDQYIRNRIMQQKPNDPSILVDRDAIVVTVLKNEDQKGFILATWDNVMVEIVDEIARIYADRPDRVIDFLSSAMGQFVESDKSYELMATLLHIDEKLAAPLAQKIDRIRSTEQAYGLERHIREARQRGGEDWQLSPEDVDPFINFRAQGKQSTS